MSDYPGHSRQGQAALTDRWGTHPMLVISARDTAAAHRDAWSAVKRSPDPRTRRTVSRLRSALWRALEHGSLENVTVSSICRDGDVRRTTFYSHYADIGELLIDVLTGELEDLLQVRNSVAKPVQQLAVEFRDSLIAAFTTVVQDRAVFRTAFRSPLRLQLRASLEDMLTRRAAAALEVLHEHGVALEADPRIAPSFVGAGLSSAVASLVFVCADEGDVPAYTDAVVSQLPSWWPRVNP